MRLALAALVALAGLAARAWPGDPLALDELDPLAQAALSFACCAGWPRSARCENMRPVRGAHMRGDDIRADTARDVAVRKDAARDDVVRDDVVRDDIVRDGVARSPLRAFAAWSCVSLAVLGVGARVHLASGRALDEWLVWYAALAFVPAAAEALAELAARSVVGARAHALVWCVALAAPALAWHGFAFASAREPLGANESHALGAALEWLARCSLLELACDALREHTSRAAFDAALGPALVGVASVALAALPSVVAMHAGRAQRNAP